MYAFKPRWIRVLAGMISLMLVAIACGGDDDAATGSAIDGTTSATAPPEDAGNFVLTLRHSWIPDDLYMPYALARAKGYFNDEGITLVDQNGNGGATAALLVANGDVMVGVGEASHVVRARARDVPLVSIAQVIQDGPAVLISLKSSDITTWEDLVGKTVGGTAASSTATALEATLALNGVGFDEIEFVNMSPGANLAAVGAGEVDAAFTFAGNVATLPFKADLNVMAFKDGGFLAPSTSIFVTEEFLAENRDVLVGFLRALTRALAEMLDDPREAAEFMAQQYALQDPDDLVARFEAQRAFYTSEITEEFGLAWHDIGRWTSMEEILLETGSSEKAVDVSEAFTNDLLEEIPKSER